MSSTDCDVRRSPARGIDSRSHCIRMLVKICLSRVPITMSHSVEEWLMTFKVAIAISPCKFNFKLSNFYDYYNISCNMLVYNYTEVSKINCVQPPFIQKHTFFFFLSLFLASYLKVSFFFLINPI